MANVVVWETDGTYFKVYSDGALVFETPLASLSVVPDILVGKDPATGLPAFCAAADLVAHQAPNDKAQQPLTDSVVTTTPPLPVVTQSSMTDMCPQLRCGAARLLAVKLVQQFQLIRGLLDWMLSAPFLITIIGDIGIGGTSVAELLTRLFSWAVQKDLPTWLLNVLRVLNFAVTTGAISLGSPIPDLDDAQQQNLWRLAYLNLDCSSWNTFKLTQGMINNWGAAIQLDTSTYPDDVQRHLMGFIIQATPFSVYDQTATNGAQDPRTGCTMWGP